MNFDAEGHLVCSPKDVYELALADAHRLLNAYLMTGTPRAFAKYLDYADFLEAVAERTGVHTKNLYVRGSCHLGFSIAPDAQKVWLAMGPESDRDLVIVDVDYFRRCEDELRRWEIRNPIKSPRERGAKAAADRARDRQFNCLRDSGLPSVVCVHHRRMMMKVAALAQCGQKRRATAFIYPDWHSAQQRYSYDVGQLCQGVAEGRFPPPPDAPLPRQPRIQQS